MLGHILGMQWQYVGDALAIWGCMAISKKCVGDMLVVFRLCFGHVPGICWRCFRMHWVFFGYVFSCFAMLLIYLRFVRP